MSGRVKWTRVAAVGAVGVALLAGSPWTRSAHAQTEFRACYVPSVGAIYLIGETGLPSNCLAASHVQFSWTDGVADGSITTAKLANGAVTSEKLANDISVGNLSAVGTVSATDFVGNSTITSFLVPNDLEMTLEPTDDPAIVSFFEIFHGSDLLFFVNENGLMRVNGDLIVEGSVSKGSGSFRIDHPLDPKNRYLSHSFVESPDMMNVYNGNVRLDEDGTAWVELPDYFEALNIDFRYQLTPVGAAAPELHIAREIEDNRFQIAGGVPGMRVSWQVTGVRNDAFARKHRIRVEELKPAEERGTLLHPEAFEEQH